MNRYPHKLYKVVVTDITENEFGQQEGGEEQTVFVSDCYEQVMGEAKTYSMPNGQSFSYSSKIFLPEGVEQIPTGTRVEVREYDGITVRLKGISNRPSGKDYEHSRLWV